MLVGVDSALLHLGHITIGNPRKKLPICNQIKRKKSLKSELLVYLQTEEDKAIIAPRTAINNPVALKDKKKKGTSPKPKPKLWMLFSSPSLLFYMASR